MPWDSRFAVRTYFPKAEYLTKSAGHQIIVAMLILCYHLWFQIEFECPCTSNRNIIYCYSYMVLPCLIIISLILWNDMRIGRIFRFACYHSSIKKGRCSYRGRFCLEFFTYLLQAASSGFLWCGSVLVDGDWYVCCGAFNSEELKTLSCMKESEIGPAEKADRVNLKNRSMVLGLMCILLTAACSFILLLPWGRWCLRRNHFRAVFEETILGQTEIILSKEMEGPAADYVTKALASLSTIAMTEKPSNIKDAPEKAEKTEDEDAEKNINWKQVACLADSLIEGIPNNTVGISPQHDTSIHGNINGNKMQVIGKKTHN